MVYNPMALATREQREALEKMQPFTRKIKYVIHTDDEKHRVEVSLLTDDQESMTLLPQLQEGIVDSITQMLYTMFDMSGERV